jgi:sulfatase maturation enzyme AslB (radical SAM superfamily)
VELEKIIDSKTYREFKGADWPTYSDFVANNYTVSDAIKKELEKFVSAMQEQYEHLSSTRTEQLAAANQARQGQIFYNKSYTGPSRCREPWQTLGVNSNGNIFICSSPSWIPIFVGNLLESNNVYDVLNCEQAKKIRLEILQNRYYYCNSTICKFFQAANPHTHKKTFNDEDTKELVLTNDQEELYVNEIPRNLIFDFDPTCNFKCPSCRIEHQNFNNHHVIRPINNNISNKIKKLIIDEIKDQHISIRWAGGEPFMSEVYIELFDYIIEKNKKNITNIVQTNGSLLKSKENLLRRFLPYISNLRISFDAGCEETYKLTRVGGNWNNLLDNVNFVKDLVKQNNFRTKLSADFVVQKNNYKDLPVFANMCRELNLSMNIQKMWNWGTWESDVFDDMNVYHKKHPLYADVEKYLRLAKLPIANN